MLDNDADISFPEAEQNLMLECYLCPGENFELILMESNNLQDDLSLQLTWNADVDILTDNENIPLLNILNIEKESRYIHNYGSPQVVPVNYSGTYSLEIVTQTGQQIKAVTKTLEFVPIQKIEEDENKIHIQFYAPENIEERYFSVIAEGAKEGEKKIIRENIHGLEWETDLVMVTVRGDIDQWDSLKVKLLHITRENYEFQESIDQAYSANIDPFTVPTKIESNISGALGIFTFYTIDSLVVR